MKSNMISIIIPVYNAEKTLERCLVSVLQQDYKDIEVIAVNDGSVDSSLQILECFASKDSRLKVFNQKNSGVSVSRNKGIIMSAGEFVMFVDSDDCIQPNACSLVIEHMGYDCDLLIFGLNIYKNSVLLRTPHLPAQVVNLNARIDNYWMLRKINLGPCNKLYRRNLITKLFDQSLSLGEDTLFVIEYMKNIKTIRCIDSCLYNVFLDNTNSLNRKYRADRLDQLIIVRKKELEALREIYPDCYDSRIYEEFFLDLHVILTGLFYHKISGKIDKIKDNVMKYDYASILPKTKFSSLYYKIFANLVSKHNYYTLFILLFVRTRIEKLFLR